VASAKNDRQSGGAASRRRRAWHRVASSGIIENDGVKAASYSGKTAKHQQQNSNHQLTLAARRWRRKIASMAGRAGRAGEKGGGIETA